MKLIIPLELLKGPTRLYKFLGANLLYTISSFLCPISLPFVLESNTLSQGYFLIQSFIILTSIFEFGLGIGYLKLYSDTQEGYKASHELLTLTVIITLIILGLLNTSYLYKLILGSTFSLLESVVLTFSVAGNLSWTWNRLVQIKKDTKNYFFESLVIILVRIGLIVYFSFDKLESAVSFFLFFYFLPHFPSLIKKLIKSVKTIYINKVSFPHIKETFSLSIFSYMEGVLFGYVSSYFIIFANKINQNEFVVSLGFSYSLIGILSFIIRNFRYYLIGSIKSNDLNSVKNYIEKIKDNKHKLFAIVFCIAIIGAGISMIASNLILHNNNLIICSFLLLLSYGVTSYYGLFSLLANQFGLLYYTIAANSIRLCIVVIICYTVAINNMYIGFVLTLFSSTFLEYVISKIIVRRVISQINS